MNNPFSAPLGRWALLLLLLSACNLPDLPGMPARDNSPATSPTKLGRTMLARVNAARSAGYDCGTKGIFEPTTPLKLEPHLSAAAQTHADDMNAEGYFSHTVPDGSTVSARVTRTGYSWSRVGENIARGYEDVDTVMTDWLKSDGHCANLLNPAYTELGVGKSDEYWVQVFARAR